MNFNTKLSLKAKEYCYPFFPFVLSFNLIFIGTLCPFPSCFLEGFRNHIEN